MKQIAQFFLECESPTLSSSFSIFTGLRLPCNVNCNFPEIIII